MIASSRVPLGVMVASVALTLGMWYLAGEEHEAEQRARFGRLSDRVAVSMQSAFRPTQQALGGLKSLVVNTGFAPTERQWSLQVEEVHPFAGKGVVGFGYVRRVPRTGLAELEEAQRRAGYAGFRVGHDGQGDTRYVVANIAPLESNQDALGLDLTAGTTRREAAEQAMQEADYVLSRRINIIVGQISRPGFLLFLPVYRTDTVPEGARREAETVGWVYAALRSDELFHNTGDIAGGQLDFEIFQGETTSGESLLYDADGHLGPTTDRQITEQDFTGRSYNTVRKVFALGRPFTMRMSTLPLFDAAGASNLAGTLLIGGLVASAFGGILSWSLVSARERALKLAEQMTANLRAAEAESQRLALVASRTSNAVGLSDADGKVVWINEGFTRLFGYTLEEARGQFGPFLIKGPHTSPRTLARITRDARMGHESRGEILNYAKDGREVWCEFETQPLRDAAGRLTGFMSIMLDVTPRKQAEAELARQEAALRFVLNSLPIGVSWTTYRDGKNTWVNDTVLSLTGLAREEAVLYESYESITVPEDWARQQAEYARLLSGETDRFRIEKRYRRRDGREVTVLFFAQLFRGEDGRIEQEVSAVVDVTQLKAIQRELEAAKEVAEKANLAKSQFLAMMSHEIRTPMNGVVGMTSLLLDTPLTSEQRDFVETIRFSGDALLTIINDILDFSKIESGHMELEQAPFQLREVVEGALDLLATKAAEKRIDLLYEIADAGPATVVGDSTRLRQVLVNLLNNALKFTERGEVVLSIGTIGTADGLTELQFDVRDTGIGIPPEAMDRLFKSFSQVDSSTARRFGGTGLGLAISKRLAEMMGGRMWVVSKVGEGSTFSFTIRVRPVASRPVLFQAAGTRLEGLHVLILDDNLTNCRILQAMTGKWGLHPHICHSGAEALRLLETGVAVELGIVDMQMPGMDGAEFAEKARQMSGREKLPLVLLSSIGRQGAARQAQGLFDSALLKPVKPSQLFDALVQAVQRQCGGPTAAGETLPPVGRSAAPRTEKILLAEDNVVNQKVAVAMLARLGFRADVVADGLEVLEAMKRRAYDVIFLDVQMPELDGLEVARRVVRAQPEAALRPAMIALTANAMQGDREECLAAGMDDYLSKPMKAAELSAAIERVLRRSRRA